MGSILDKNYIIASNKIKTLKTNQCCELSLNFNLSCRLLGIVFNMFEQLWLTLFSDMCEAIGPDFEPEVNTPVRNYV